MPRGRRRVRQRGSGLRRRWRLCNALNKLDFARSGSAPSPHSCRPPSAAVPTRMADLKPAQGVLAISRRGRFLLEPPHGSAVLSRRQGIATTLQVEPAPSTSRRMSVSLMSCFECRPSSAATIAASSRGMPSASNANTWGVTRSIIVSRSAEEVKRGGMRAPAAGHGRCADRGEALRLCQERSGAGSGHDPWPAPQSALEREPVGLPTVVNAV
jgi:hypothetical protein